MISKLAEAYCSEALDKIDNYKLAIEDTKRIWHIHHKLECGQNPIPRKELIAKGLYYNVPANQLTFVPASVHWHIHLASRKGRKFNLQSWMPQNLTIED